MITIPDEPQTRGDLALLLGKPPATLNDAIVRYGIPVHDERRKIGPSFRNLRVIKPPDIRELVLALGMAVNEAEDSESDETGRALTEIPHESEGFQIESVPAVIEAQHTRREAIDTHYRFEIAIPRDWPRRAVSVLLHCLRFVWRILYAVVWCAWWLVSSAARLILWLHVPPSVYSWLCEEGRNA